MKSSRPIGLPGLEEVEPLLTPKGDRTAVRAKRNVVPEGTDRERWGREDSFRPAWSRRASVAGTFVDPDSWVCEIGSGPTHSIRSFLPYGCRYFPADLVKWTPDTEVCELNEGLLPTFGLERADTCVMLGVLEYVEASRTILERIATYVDCLVLTYHPADCLAPGRDARWKRPLSLAEIRSAVGCEVESRFEQYAPAEVILRYDIQSTPAKKMRRQQARGSGK